MKKALYVISALLLSLCIYYFYPEKKLPKGAKIDAIVVQKAKRKMEVYQQGKKLAEYTISLGKVPEGKKVRRGDHKTPEGVFQLIKKEDYALGRCGYHSGLLVSYPNVAMADNLSGPKGSHVLLHGLKNKFWYLGKFHRWIDWTDGCIAVTDDEIDEIYAATPNGTKVTIYP